MSEKVRCLLLLADVAVIAEGEGLEERRTSSEKKRGWDGIQCDCTSLVVVRILLLGGVYVCCSLIENKLLETQREQAKSLERDRKKSKEI